MKKYFFSLAAISVSLLASDSTTSISDTLTFAKKVMPDKMQTSIVLEVQDKTFEGTKRFMKLNYMTKISPICKLESSQVSPLYSYQKGKQIMEGYSATSRLGCEFNDIREYDKELNAIYQEADSKLKITANPIRWVVSEAIEQATISELKSEAVKAANMRAKILQNELGSNTCTVKSIRLEPVSHPRQPYPMMAMAKANVSDLTPTESPAQTEQTISLSASYEWECNTLTGYK